MKLILPILNTVIALWALPTLASETTVKASPGGIQTYETFVGKIKFNEEYISHVNPRYEGLVKRVFVEIGDSVKKNQKLAVVERSVGLENYYIRAASQGRIVAKSLSVGEIVGPSTLAFSIANLSMLWMEIAVKPKYLHSLKIGDKLPLSTHSNQTSFVGEIFYKSPFIDNETRTGTILLRTEENGNKLRPGLFVESHIPKIIEKVNLSVPISSVYFKSGNFPLVQVKRENKWEIRSVKTGIRDFERIEIISGLEVNEEVSSVFLEELVIQKTDHSHEHSKKDDDHQDHEHGEDH